MPGPNAAGTPNVRDYLIGRGILYFALLNAAGKPVSYRDLGNAPDFSISSEKESIDHESSRAGLKIVDRTVTIRQKAGVKFSLDEFNHENWAAFLSGTTAVHTNVSIAGFTVFVMVPDGELALGRWYDIRNASGARAYDVQQADLTVTTNEASPIAMVANTDYILDSEMGRIFVLSTSTVAATSITAVKGLKVTLVANAAGNVVNQVTGLTATSVRGALKFVGSNASDSGKPIEIEMPSVSLAGSGDLGLISDEFAKMEFEGTCETGTFSDGTTGTVRLRTVAAGGGVL